MRKQHGEETKRALSLSSEIRTTNQLVGKKELEYLKVKREHEKALICVMERIQEAANETNGRCLESGQTLAMLMNEQSPSSELHTFGRAADCLSLSKFYQSGGGHKPQAFSSNSSIKSAFKEEVK